MDVHEYVCKIIEFLLWRQNWNIFSLCVFEDNMNRKSTSLIPIVIAQTFRLVLSRCLQYFEVRMWLRYALHKSSWGIVSHKKSLMGLSFCQNVNEKMQYREIFSEWSSLSSISSSSEGVREGITLHTEISKLNTNFCFYSSTYFFNSLKWYHHICQYSSFSSLLRVACSDSTPLDKLIQHFSPQCCVCSNINSTSCLYVLLLFTSYNE